MEYLATKENELLAHGTTRMNFKNMLCEKKKQHNFMNTFI